MPPRKRSASKKGNDYASKKRKELEPVEELVPTNVDPLILMAGPHLDLNTSRSGPEHPLNDDTDK